VSIFIFPLRKQTKSIHTHKDGSSLQHTHHPRTPPEDHVHVQTSQSHRVKCSAQNEGYDPPFKQTNTNSSSSHLILTFLLLNNEEDHLSSLKSTKWRPFPLVPKDKRGFRFHHDDAKKHIPYRHHQIRSSLLLFGRNPFTNRLTTLQMQSGGAGSE